MPPEPTPPVVSIAATVHRLRLENNWTLQELADAAGVAIGTVHNIEGGAMPHTTTLLALALSLKVRQQQAEKLLAERLAECDPLTGLLNRRGFNQQAAPLWSTSLRNQRPLSLIMLDLDHFKGLNDQYGHDFGDQALQAVASLLAGSCRAGDLSARWGGEEFLLLLPETALGEAHALAVRLRQAIQAIALRGGEQPVNLSCSCGVVQRSEQEQLEHLINHADRLLYAAKQSGRNRVVAGGPAQPGCT